jgi:hypothetical protein
VSRRRVGRPHEIAHRRPRQLSNASESRQGRRRHTALPARDGDGLDPELVCKVFLGQTGAAPGSAQSPPHSAAIVGPQLGVSYQSGRPDAVIRADALSTTAQSNPFPAPSATLVSLGEEERSSTARQAMAEETAAQFHSSGPTLTSIFPMFSPRRRPRKARGAFSMPSTIVSRCLRRPSCSQPAASRANSPNRSKWSVMM